MMIAAVFVIKSSKLQGIWCCSALLLARFGRFFKPQIVSWQGLLLNLRPSVAAGTKLEEAELPIRGRRISLSQCTSCGIFGKKDVGESSKTSS
jgi:hypothetical protein